MAVREEKITLKPMDMIWGSRQKDSVQAIADVGGALDGLRFNANSARNVNKFYFWMDVDAGGNDPGPISGRTGVPVAISTGDSAAVVAAAIQAAADALDDFNASVVGDLVTIEASEPGATDAIAEVDSGFTFTALTTSIGRDLGGTTTDGVEISFDVNLVDVQAAQLGEQIADQINNATNLTISSTMLELTPENWELLMGQVTGDIYNDGSQDYVAIGESKRFQNMSQYSYELMMKPVGAADNSENFHFWKVYPILENVSFSGSDLAQMPVSFRALRDTTKDTKISLGVLASDGTKISSL